MATIVEFRTWRNEADAARPQSPATASRVQATDDPFTAGAEIILMPLNWLKQLGNSRPRKPLKRRFALREMAPA